jgi:hypothetical protein
MGWRLFVQMNYQTLARLSGVIWQLHTAGLNPERESAFQALTAWIRRTASQWGSQMSAAQRSRHCIW